jgi:hypothetical protein
MGTCTSTEVATTVTQLATAFAEVLRVIYATDPSSSTVANDPTSDTASGEVSAAAPVTALTRDHVIRDFIAILRNLADNTDSDTVNQVNGLYRMMA